MSSKTPSRPIPNPVDPDSRRGFLTATAALLGGGAVAWGLTSCGSEDSPSGAGGVAPVAHAEKSKAHVAPGEHDDYYGFWSGGQSGEIRVLGIPSMRELKRIPVFNFDAATGWGADDWSKALLKGRISGDTHHVHLSYTDGTYDGRYVYVNDKASARLARVDLKQFEVDAIADIPNSQGTHGIFPQRHKTGLVLCNSEFRSPQPNDGRDMDDPTKYAAMHTAIDGETMQAVWQVMVNGNMDLCATDYEGKYSFATCYNSEGGVTLEQMMGADQDWLYVFNLANIQAAVDAGKTITVGDFDKVIDGRGGDNEFVQRIPVPKSPHGVNITPDGKYAVVSGKLSPTCSVVDISKIDAVFAGSIKPRDAVVAEPEVGLGPLHTAFDGKGNAYTSIFIDSVMTKWNIDLAIKQFNGEAVEPVLEKVDVHYQVGHTNASMSETKEADGKWLVALCKFSKDRFLPTGPLRSENDQLIDMTSEKLEVVHDGTAYPEPHDAVIVAKDKIHPEKIATRTGSRYEMYEKWAAEDGVDLKTANEVIRKGPKSVRVYMTSQAPSYGMTEMRVKAGDTVTFVCTNIDNVEDLSHGFCLIGHDCNMVVNTNGTNSITVKIPNKGMYWFYCPWFCHALHLEMRGRLFVE
ncbi:MAG: nitrous-oxide reductase [Proteobacteria bacterium]|nr:nitrous-oxide reductase [Pseudomonadota bacterium]